MGCHRRLEDSADISDIFPFSEGAELHLSQRAAQRLYHLRDRIGLVRRSASKSPSTSCRRTGRRFWRAVGYGVYTGWDYSDHERFMVDLLLAPVK